MALQLRWELGISVLNHSSHTQCSTLIHMCVHASLWLAALYLQTVAFWKLLAFYFLLFDSEMSVASTLPHLSHPWLHSGWGGSWCGPLVQSVNGTHTRKARYTLDVKEPLVFWIGNTGSGILCVFTGTWQEKLLLHTPLRHSLWVSPRQIYRVSLLHNLQRVLQS